MTELFIGVDFGSKDRDCNVVMEKRVSDGKWFVHSVDFL